MAHTARRARAQALGAGLLLAVAACANTGEPPGGPPDEKPPVVLGVYPESGAVLTQVRGDAVIQFDGVIDEMGAGGGMRGGQSGGVSGLAAQILLSPTRGPVKVSWHRSSVHVKPKEGWQPDRVYHLEILPGIVDLRRNVMKEGRRIIFSTGPAIPEAALSGMAVQWIEQRALVGGLIRAVPLPDTLAYLTVADSTGAFRLDHLPAGRYAVYAVADQNTNRVRDRREAYDSALVILDSSATIVLWTFAHDTVGPRLRQAEPVDSVAARLTFSSPLDPWLRPESLAVRVVVLPDSAPIRVRALYTAAAYDSLAARARALADSVRAATDTTLRKPAVDTSRRDTTVRAPAPSVAAAETSLVRLTLRQRPVPQDKLILVVDTMFTPGGRYVVEIRGARNLNGAVATASHTVLVVPKPKPVPPADSTRARPDSTPPPRPRVQRDSTRP